MPVQCYHMIITKIRQVKKPYTVYNVTKCTITGPVAVIVGSVSEFRVSKFRVSKFSGHYSADLEFRNVTIPPCHNSAVSQFRMSKFHCINMPRHITSLLQFLRPRILDYAHTQSLVVYLSVENGVYCKPERW
jgi:hypothetical protein